MNSLEGVISKILHHERSTANPAGVPFLIARLTNQEIVKGEARKVIEGERYRFYGEKKPQRKYGNEAFEFVSYEAVIEQSADGVATYLATHVDGLGRVKSAAIVAAFGDETLAILRADPARALEVKGVTQQIVDCIRRHFDSECKVDPVAYAKLIDLFSGHDIPKKVVNALLNSFGSDAPAKIIENPYFLLAYPRIGWKTADSFALATAGYDPVGIERHKAAILESLERIADDGHTYGTSFDIESLAVKLVNGKVRPDAWDSLVIDGEMVRLPRGSDGSAVGFDEFALPAYWVAENTIAMRLSKLADAADPLPFDLDIDSLKGDQIEAASILGSHGVCLLIGPPGCGKSWTIARAIKSLVRHGIEAIRIVTPTGKAAKRAAELLRQAGLNPDLYPCTTIHKALSPRPSMAPEGAPSADAKVGRGRDEFGFGRNEENPLEVQVLIIDEGSMVDVKLASALLSAISPGTRIIFVGDHNQLPSVGAGAFLRDMITAGLPTAELREIKRSDGGGRVVRACHSIIGGRRPEPARVLMLPTENWIHLEESDPNAIARTIVELHGIASTFDPMWDYQVVSAQRSKHAFACDNLNQMLSVILNRPTEEDIANWDEPFRMPFRIGDKIIRRKNGTADQLCRPAAAPLGSREGNRTDFDDFDNPDDFDDFEDDSDLLAGWRWGKPGVEAVRDWHLRPTAIVNGDLGQILDIVPEEHQTWIVVRFRDPDRLCRIPYSEHFLQLAYAITVHSAQGSGWPVVIVPVHLAFYKELFSRELFYTAISRAEQALITVGQWSAVETAIGRKTVDRRRTKLVSLIKERFVSRVMEVGS
jgi:exodeoxyribonuclease V alpha subunit